MNESYENIKISKLVTCWNSSGMRKNLTMVVKKEIEGGDEGLRLDPNLGFFVGLEEVFI